MYLHIAVRLIGMKRLSGFCLERVQHARLGSDDELLRIGLTRVVEHATGREHVAVCAGDVAGGDELHYRGRAPALRMKIRNSALGWAARRSAMSSALMPACTWHSPSRRALGGLVLRRPYAPPRNTSGRNSISRSAGIERRCSNVYRVPRRAAIIALGFHFSRRVDVRDDDRARVFGLPTAELRTIDRRRQRATGRHVRQQHRLVGREYRCRLGHEMHAAKHDDLGRRLGRLARQNRASRRRSPRRPGPRRARNCGRG